MKSKRLLLLTAVVAALCLITSNGVALADSPHTESHNVTVHAHVPPTVSLTITGDVDFVDVAPSATAYTQDLAFEVKSNKHWTVQVYKNGDLTDGTNTIASSQLVFDGGDLSDTPFPASGSAAELFNPGHDRTASETFDVTYKLTVNWTDEASDYAATHVYTLVQS
jgi:hypothetical protein